jgi:ATP-dependent helicase HrpB
VVSPTPLPVDAYLPEIVRVLERHRAVVITAAPGAGKTTRVPPALVAAGRVCLLQPRRLAARAIARRIAHEQAWTVGREVGWHVRFERMFQSDTRLIVATEGILTARLQQDALLSDLRTVIIDEFHERSVHGDLGLALARQAWLARDDLRIVVMSATLDAGRVAAFLGGCPVVDVPGRLYPIEISHRPGVAVEQAIADLLPRTTGALLCFLPGTPEIRRTAERLAMMVPPGTEIVPLHGSLDADEQDRAVAPSARPRVILSTNIAETTLTVPDVTAVVDTGLQKVARYDPERLVDSLDTERISRDSADQRAGRAGRTQAGLVVRLWGAHDRMRPHREPEIARVDLASVVMDVLSWGGDPRTLDWFEAPPPHGIEAAIVLLARLGAVDESGRLTRLGHDLGRLPLHPRLGRLLLSARGSTVAARACALLSERHVNLPTQGTTTCDLLAVAEGEHDLPPHVLRVARRLAAEAASVLGNRAADRIEEIDFRRAVLCAYPDRVARRREPRSNRFVLASGTGARLARESGVYDAEFVVAVDVATSASVVAPNGEALIRTATAVEREWLRPTSLTVLHEWDPRAEMVRARRLEWYDAMALSEHPAAPDPDEAGRIVADEYTRRGPTERDAQLMRRIGFAGAAMSFPDLVRVASEGARRFSDVDLSAHVPRDLRQTIDRLAPDQLQLPRGRRARLAYLDDGRVVAAVKLQHVFGLAEAPRLGPRQVSVTFELLAPNGRPVQVTTDLASFWARAYPELRNALRARYPKHEW